MKQCTFSGPYISDGVGEYGAQKGHCPILFVLKQVKKKILYWQFFLANVFVGLFILNCTQVNSEIMLSSFEFSS